MASAVKVYNGGSSSVRSWAIDSDRNFSVGAPCLCVVDLMHMWRGVAFAAFVGKALEHGAGVIDGQCLDGWQVERGPCVEPGLDLGVYVLWHGILR